MAGRPPRNRDLDFQARVVAALKRGKIGPTALARAIGVSPSTLTRSFNSGSYSRDVAAQIEILLRQGWPPPAISVSEDDRLQKCLQNLQNFAEVLPDIRAVLLEVLDQRDRPQ